MFDDFDTMIQSDEIIPEEYDDWMRWMYENGSSFTEAEQKLYWEQLNKKAINTGININNYF